MSKKSVNVDRLSVREAEVLRLAARGQPDKQIGRELEISANTLRTYWARIREKLGEGSRTRLAAIWLEEEHRQRELDAPVGTPTSLRSWIFDLAERRMLVSDDINIARGLPPGQWHPAEAYARAVHPDDLGKIEDAVAAAVSGLAANFSFTHRMLSLDGVEIVHSHGAIETDEEGTPRFARGQTVALQTTAIVEVVAVGLWTRSPDRNQFHADRECCEIFSINYEKDAGRLDRFLSRVHPEDRIAAFGQFCPTHDDQAMPDVRFRIRHPDGRYHWVRSHVKWDTVENHERLLTGTIIAA